MPILPTQLLRQTSLGYKQDSIATWWFTSANRRSNGTFFYFELFSNTEISRRIFKTFLFRNQIGYKEIETKVCCYDFFSFDQIQSSLRERTENRRESPVQLFNHQNRRRRVVWLRCCRKMMLIFYSDKDQRSAGLIFFRKRSTSVEDWKDLAFSQNKITRMHCWPPPPG